MLLFLQICANIFTSLGLRFCSSCHSFNQVLFNLFSGRESFYEIFCELDPILAYSFQVPSSFSFSRYFGGLLMKQLFYQNLFLLCYYAFVSPNSYYCFCKCRTNDLRCQRIPSVSNNLAPLYVRKGYFYGFLVYYYTSIP